jgi:hypothetical protein
MEKLSYFVKFLSHDAMKNRTKNYKDSLTMVPKEGIFAALLAIKYVVENDIPGDIVECGVWRGGMSILMAGMLRLHNSCRKLYLYDTFSGMTVPGYKDGFIGLEPEKDDFVKSGSTLPEVKTNFEKADLLDENIIFIEGDVCETLNNNDNLPQRIAFLRLDTDMYASTKKELEIFYPRISDNGVLVVDDYGAWIGCKPAVDEYFASIGHRPFFSYIDRHARIWG